MWRMAAGAASTAGPQVWFENQAEWRWPGDSRSRAEILPPAWVPALPPSRIAVERPADAQRGVRRQSARNPLPAVLLAGLAALGATLAIHGGLQLGASRAAPASRPARAAAQGGRFSMRPLPALTVVSRASSGSEIAHVGFPSLSVDGQGGFLVYLPPHFSRSSRYPVLYLLHGNEQRAVEFLREGDLQRELDTLTAAGEVPPMIAVMPEGGHGAIEWRNIGAGRWESYVLEVQELVDRMLPTIRDRDARAVAGDSMGAFGAMSVTLNNIYRFGAAESWLGFFNGLEGQLSLDRPAIHRLGLTAFVYGGTEDHIANPDEDRPFAAALRAAGAEAHSAIYPGEHNMQTVQAHIASQLRLIGQFFARGERRGGAE